MNGFYVGALCLAVNSSMIENIGKVVELIAFSSDAEVRLTTNA